MKVTESKTTFVRRSVPASVWCVAKRRPPTVVGLSSNIQPSRRVFGEVLLEISHRHLQAFFESI